ncbi:MAG TPA: hypothetical protein VFU94_11360 [Conexibacter sp.]|nr:hypothetical protein [Conexibacter sp.]
MELLRIYLQDHFAASCGALELAKRAAGSNRGTEFEQPLAQLRDDLAEDREALRDAMARLGVGADRLKEGASWSAEKLGRLKLNGRWRGYSPLSRVVELEGLAMLICAERRLWDVLGAHVDAARLHGLDVAALAARADDQLARLRELHGHAAALAFARAPAAA